MLEQLLISANINYTIRKTERGERYAGFQIAFGNEQHAFTAISRYNYLRIFVHEILKPANNEILAEYINSLNEKWLLGKVYYNPASGFIEGSCTIYFWDEKNASEKIWFYLYSLNCAVNNLKSFYTFSFKNGEARCHTFLSDFADKHNKLFPSYDDGSLLKSLQYFLIESGYDIKNKFNNDYVSATFSPGDKKIVFDLFIRYNAVLVVQSYPEIALNETKIKSLVTKIHSYNCIVDAGTISLRESESKYFFYQAFPICFFKINTGAINSSITQAIQVHEYIGKSIQIEYGY